MSSLMTSGLARAQDMRRNPVRRASTDSIVIRFAVLEDIRVVDQVGLRVVDADVHVGLWKISRILSPTES